MKPLRVLLISHSCATRSEGQPKAELLGRMPGLCLRVVIPHRWNHYGSDWRAAEPPLPGASFECEIKKVLLPSLGPVKWHMHWYPALARTFKEFRPDVIDLWEEPWDAVSAQVVRLRRKLCPNAKIVTETEQNINKRLPFPFEQFRRYVLRHADYAVARSSEAAGVMRAKGFARPIEVVPNAVDGELFHPLAPPEREATRRELGFDGFVGGYVGRLAPEKGLPDMIEALPHCPPSIRLVFVGNGSMRGELQRRAEALKVISRVTFVEAKPLAELPGIMGALDALVLPSHTTPQWKEQFGRVIIEAHACETPVIGSDSGAIPGVIGEGGLVFPEGDVKVLAAAMSRLASDPAEARRFGRAGREQVEKHYTWQRVAERMACIYEKVAGRVEPRNHDRAPLQAGAETTEAALVHS